MISFDIHMKRSEFLLDVAGEFGDGITAVFGSSGAGKSSLLDCLAGSIRPDSGHVQMGETIWYSSLNRVWVTPENRRVGTVYQDGALFPHLDVRSNIEFGWKLIPEHKRHIDPLELADFMGLSNLMSRKPSTLSGGERQRVAIARSIAIMPSLLLLDEPLASIDSPRRGSILNYLKRVHAEFEMPMIYVSHSISEVVSVASNAMMLEAGKVVGFDHPTALLPYVNNSEGIDKFENIFDGVIGPSTDYLTTVEVNGVEIWAGRQRKSMGERVLVSLGANQIILAAQRPANISARNIIEGKVVETWSNLGKVFVEVDAGPKFIVELTETALKDLGILMGCDVFLVFKSSSVGVFDT
ncbi:MAG: molybdenum ABC transporter ATP-binding protein [Chloroflexota bacterium]|nr:molybdenum ABC transporter ATP-binding protein [Chloroflexota bacterium]MQG37835.1 molybdenum ABC transporter ATP-binding protein [SAR202 cluster bacterium]|tara:strand:- start:3312 stop:4373 length:1062 start_codon:yes stop_codon:yes gene_type:complete